MNIFNKSYWYEAGEYGDLKFFKVAIHVVAFFIILTVLLAAFPFGTVGTGERGIKIRLNSATDTVLSEGLYFRVPFVERVVKIDVRVQKEEVQASAASKDLQKVSTQVALNYSVAPESVVTLYRTVGTDYKSRIIDPAIQEAVKAATAKFTAEELITKREEVSGSIKANLTERLALNGILVEGLSVTDFAFSPKFDEAIEKKVTAEQNALAAKNALEQTKYEKEAAIISAQGRAEALRIEAAAISNSPQVVELRAIEKWNGVLPTTTGSAVPFINIK